MPCSCCGGDCTVDGDCTAPPGEVALCCDGVCKNTGEDLGACYSYDMSTCYDALYSDCGRDNQSNVFMLCEVCPP